MPKIDVIIPAYNADMTIDRAILSVGCQTIASDCVITIVDDCSDCSYEDLREKFAFMPCKIRVIRMKENGGPGAARQYGIDHTRNPYIVFLDADDTLADALSLQTLLAGMAEGIGMVSGAFDEQTAAGIVHHADDIVWMHGKMYARKFIEQYDIRFHPTSRANEDNGFNSLVKIVCAVGGQWKVSLQNRTVYIWHNRKDSITREANFAYYFGDSFTGYAENMIYAARYAEKLFPGLYKNDWFRGWVAANLCFLYAYYSECYYFRPDLAEKNLYACRTYFDMVYRNVMTAVSAEELAQNYATVMTKSYRRRPYIPARSISEFIEDLQKTTY